jgi:hypothetical protein
MTTKLTHEGLESKLDRLEDKLDQISVTLLVNTSSLEKHMLRTELQEKQLEILKAEIVPITKHVSQVSGGLKVLGILSLVLSIVITIKSLLLGN